MKFKSTKHFVNYLFEQAEPQSSDSNPPNVEFPEWLESKLKTVHGQPGQGSIFKDPDSVKKLVLDLVEKESVKIPEIASTTGTIKTNVSGIGYDLVVSKEEAEKLPNAEMSETEKVEGPNKVTVPMVKTSAPIEQFSTDQLTVIVRPKKDSSGKPLPNEYIILSAFPGKDLPRASEWNGKYVIVMPNVTTSQTIAESRFDLSRWKKMAGILKG